jgi:hypothetical protein
MLYFKSVFIILSDSIFHILIHPCVGEAKPAINITPTPTLNAAKRTAFFSIVVSILQVYIATI